MKRKRSWSPSRRYKSGSQPAVDEAQSVLVECGADRNPHDKTSRQLVVGLLGHRREGQYGVACCRHSSSPGSALGGWFGLPVG